MLLLLLLTTTTKCYYCSTLQCVNSNAKQKYKETCPSNRHKSTKLTKLGQLLVCLLCVVKLETWNWAQCWMRWTLFTNVCNFLAYSILVTNTAASGQEVLSRPFGSFWCVRQEVSFCETSQFFRLCSVGFQRNIKHQTPYDVCLTLQEMACWMWLLVQSKCIYHRQLQEMHGQFPVPLQSFMCSIIRSYQLVNLVHASQMFVVITNAHRTVNKNFMTATDTLSWRFLCVRVGQCEHVAFILEFYA